jgi:hypothetical protein
MKAASAGGNFKMGHLIVVRATWDSEVKVWTAESSDLPGLVTEATSLDELDAKLPDLIRDLLDGDDCDDNDGGFDIPVEVIASYSRKVRVGAQAA